MKQEFPRLKNGRGLSSAPGTPENGAGTMDTGAAEEDAAALANRPVRNAYREVPLTGCQLSLLPTYR